MKIDPLDHRSQSSRSVAGAQRTHPRIAAPVVDKRNYARPDGRSTTAPPAGMKSNAAPRYKVPDADLYRIDRNLSERIARASASQLGRGESRPVSRAESTISSARYRPESRLGGYRPESRVGGYTAPKPPGSTLSVASSSPLPRVRSSAASTVSPRNATPMRSPAPPRAPAVVRAQTAPVSPKPKLAASTPVVKYRVPSGLRTQVSHEHLEAKKALVLEFTLTWSGVNDVTTLCLLDPNATVALISESFVKEHGIPKMKRETPIELFDSEKNPIPNAGKAHTYPLVLRHQMHYTRETFEVATVDDRVNAILPASWIDRHELIGLFGGAQYFGTASCLQNCTKANASRDPAAAPATLEPAPTLRSKKSGPMSRAPVNGAGKRSVSGSNPTKRPATKPTTSPPRDTLKPKTPLPSRSPQRPTRTPAPARSPLPKKSTSPDTRTSPGRRTIPGADSRIPQRKTSSTHAQRTVSPALSNASSAFDPNPSS